MTRETKLGLGVGTSFLSLVAVVAFHAMSKPEEPPPAPEVPPPVAVASGPQVPADLPLAGTGIVTVGAQENTPPPGGDTKPPALPTVPQPPVGKPPLVSPTPPVIAPSPPPVGQQTPPLGLPEPPGLPPLPGKPANDPPAPPPPPPGADLMAKAGQVQLPPPPGAPKESNPVLPAPPIAPPPKFEPGLTPLPPIPGEFDARPAIEALVATGGVVAVPVVKAPMPPPIGMDLVDNKPPAMPPIPKTVSVQPDPLPPPPVGKEAGPVPQIGGNSGVTSPVIQLPAMPPAANNNVTVESHRELLYKCEPGDRTFADVSKHRYLDEKYAEALYEYNRNHPLGKDAAARPSALQPGNVVAIPTLDVLQKEYGKLIPDGPAPSPVNIAAPPTPEPGPAPVPKLVPVVTSPSTAAPGPVVNGPGNPPAPPPVIQAKESAPAGTPNQWGGQPAQAPPPGAKLYWVPQGGRQFYEIARETMGDGKRWSEIWRLNPQYDPQYPVPAGSQLHLPADARVGQ